MSLFTDLGRLDSLQWLQPDSRWEMYKLQKDRQ